MEWTAGVLAACLVAAVLLVYYARRANERAEANLALAREAVDESLSSADRDPTLTGGDVPQVEEFRRELLSKAERYTAFMSQDPRGEIGRRIWRSRISGWGISTGLATMRHCANINGRSPGSTS